ncbi:NAD(P)-dependent oxidoreductase [Rhizobium sp. NFR12]|uniref:NAD-dependent epimerase/dehydratase family protein n=1 Tax=Rhizobium sp. NFR12 TaxID=1566261 RepID=UPI0008A74793|nr:NAD(P)-dependent oxidoreductase [Rhizobium sp. NFR12]SEH30994.1 UDP-glucose 4-epimerase [Rhizobium sp. NFR12]
MRVLITGGTGFIGLATAEALLALGHEVFLFAPAPLSAAFANAPTLTGARLLLGDIRAEADIVSALTAARPDAVLHLAAITPDADAERRMPAMVIEVNIGGTANLLKALSDTGGTNRLVTTSSVAVYGQIDAENSPIVEDISLPDPNGLYGITKLAAEKTAIRLAGLYDIDVRIGRLGPVFGPWEHGTGVRPLLSPHAQVLQQWRQGEVARLPRPMSGDWLYSRDAAAGLVALLTGQRLQQVVYNIGPGWTETVEAWALHLSQMVAAPGVRLTMDNEQPTVRISMPRDRAALSIDRLVADTGFTPRYRLEEAATDYADWLNNFDPITKGTPE